MKKIYLIPLVLILLIGGYFLYSGPSSVTKSTSDTQEEVATNVLTINTNSDSDVGAVLNFSDGGGVVIYTTEHEGTEKINKLIGRSADGDIATLNIDPATLLPTTMEIDGYTYTYHRFTNIGVDISVTDPDGNTSEVETALFEQPLAKGNFLVPEVHAAIITKGVTWVTKNIQKFVGKKAAANTLDKLDFDDTMDAELWEDYIGKIENIATCAISLVTMAVPNPASALGIVLGCGSFLAETIPNYSPLAPDLCNTKDAYTTSCIGHIMNTAKKALLDSGDVLLYGSIVPDIFVSGGFPYGAEISFKHRSGKYIVTKTPKRFGRCKPTKVKVGASYEFVEEEDCVQGRILKQGFHDVVVYAEGYETRTFALAISDDRILIKEGDTTVHDEKRDSFYSKQFWEIRLEKEEEKVVEKTEELVEEVTTKENVEPEEKKKNIWKFTYKWTSGTESGGKYEHCWLVTERSVKYTINEDNSIGYGIFEGSKKAGSISSGKVTLTPSISGEGTTADGSLNLEAGTGSGTWAQEHSTRPSYAKQDIVSSCSGTWTAEKQ